MRIGELSTRTGVSVRLLRYYEEQGLLSPRRLPSGYRTYAEADVTTVRGIRMLLAAGLNTATIAQLLPCLADDGRRLVPACSGMDSDLRRERERINDAMADLMTAREALDRLISAVPAGPVDQAACEAALAAAR